MRVLVAGGAGFIGSHLCERLLADGHDVLCFDNLLTGNVSNIEHLLDNPHFAFTVGDITKVRRRQIWNEGLEVIFHLASPASPLGYWRYPLETIAANTVGTQNLLELAEELQIPFLFASTSEIYGNPGVHPQPEEYWGHVNSFGPRSCYDEGKRLGETLCYEYIKRGVDVRIVRIFNTYGPRCGVDDGRMVPAFLTALLKGEPAVLHNPDATRSLCYVTDTVDGLCRAMWESGAQRYIYNIGGDDEATVLTWFRRCVQAAGKLGCVPIPIQVTAPRPDDPQRRCPDTRLARTQLGWRPKVDAETGLLQTATWLHAQFADGGATSGVSSVAAG